MTRPLRPARRLSLALLLAVIPAACTVTDDQAGAIGAEESAKLDRQLPLVTDPQLVGYLDSIGRAIASRATTGDDLRWRFQLVNSDQVNAFALPGGFVYVNRGLVARAQSLSELAGVLGHEIGHVTLRHSARQMEKAQRTNVGVGLLCTLTNVCDNELGRAAVSAGGSALLARFSRTDELEADSVAVEYMVRAGVDPDGVPTLFGRLLEERGRRPIALEAMFGTHPMEERRIEQASALIAGMEEELPTDLVKDDAGYQAWRRRLQALPAAPEVRAP